MRRETSSHPTPDSDFVVDDGLNQIGTLATICPITIVLPLDYPKQPTEFAERQRRQFFSSFSDSHDSSI
jgi:hypothetical protein